jgi:hypothetical protein
MMAALVDQVKQEVDKSKSDNRLEAFVGGIESHRAKVEGLQKELLAKLAELEKEEKRHITSEDIHTGFDVSHVGFSTCTKKKACLLQYRLRRTSRRRKSKAADRNLQLRWNYSILMPP